MPIPSRTASRVVRLAGAALPLLAACGDPATQPQSTPAAPSRPALAIVDASRGGAAGFYWLSPTVATQPATFPGAFDAAAGAGLAVELCALGAGDACDGAPVARYTAQTTPYAQQIRADTARQFYLVYWNTAASAGAPVVAGKTYRARVLAGGGAAARELGALDVRVVATSAEANAVDRTRYAAVIAGQQLPLRFRVEQGATAPAQTVSAAFVDAVARQLYDRVVSGAGAEAAIGDVLGAFVRIVQPAEASQLEALQAQGIPLVLAEQIPTLARAYADGGLMSVDQFVAAANAAGATTQGGAAVTRAYLTQALQPAAALTEHGPATAANAFVMALGRERARRAGAPSDPVWGDGQLDPLQTLLLLYAFNFSRDAAPSVVTAMDVETSRLPATPTAALADLQFPRWSTAGGPVSVRGLVTGLIGKAIEMPLTITQAVSSSACASVILYGHKFQLQASAKEVDKKFPGAKRPLQSEVTATLVFDFTPNERAKQWFSAPLVGCKLPPSGPAAGRTVEWKLNDPLGTHGALHGAAGSTTDASGRAFATYRTFDEVVPEALHTIERSDNGTVDVRAKELVPGWRNLERSVGVGVYNPTDAGIRLTVFYHDWPSAVKLEYSMGLEGTLLNPGLTHHTTITGELTLPKQEHDGVVEYYANGPFAYSDYRITGSASSGCSYVTTFTVSGRAGFELVGYDPSGKVAPMTGMPYPDENAFGIEHYNIVCKSGTFPSAVGGVGVLQIAVYQPIDAGPLHFLSKNAITGWEPIGSGKLRKTMNRTVSGNGLPVTEHSTWTLTLVP